MTSLSGTYNRHNGGSYSGGTALPQARPPLRYRIAVEALLLALLAVLVAGGLLARNRSLGEEATPVKTSFGIKSSREPLQRTTPVFTAYIDTDAGAATLTSNTAYSISARVEGIRAYDDEISSVAPYDLLLSWGNVADGSVEGSLTWEQADRQGMVSGSLKNDDASELNSAYIISHVSNSHVVADNDEIMAGLAGIRPGDTVRIDGRLVDLEMTSGSRRLHVYTSKSRFDQGAGACEVIYVERLQVNDRTY